MGGHSVNGVSELHSKLLRTELLKDFYDLWPGKFNNKTNGITQRRWLLKANTKLSDLITDAIGGKWVNNLYDMEKLLSFADDASFREKWQDVKAKNKEFLADYIKETTGVLVDPSSLFDVQVKRIHEYKRQLLFCFYVISQYLKLKENPNANILPRTFIFGGKAAPGYFMAKLIIKFINNVAYVVNNDRTIKNKLKVVFLENYRVSLAEKIFPASELSEQISTAGTEASGTGCMKFMINGALTIGTLDGANIEMAEAVGRDNIFIFGLKVDEIRALRARGYNPREYVSRSPVLKEIFRLIKCDFFSVAEADIFDPIMQSLLSNDTFLVCADFDLYLAAQNIVSEAYRRKTEWTKTSIINVAKSGKFSSDRTIMEYARDIWDVPFNNHRKNK